MEFTRIIFEKKDGVAKITLNRPDKYNALDLKSCSEILAAFDDIEQDTSTKVAVIASTGKAFCTGADIMELSELPTEAGAYLRATRGREIPDVVAAIENCTKPVIAAIQGMALGGGLELVEACDLAIASEDARLGDQHINQGFIPGGGGTQRLPRLISIRKAKEILLTGDWIPAKEAERLGLVNKAVPADKLDSAVQEMCDKLKVKSAAAMRAIKTLVNQGMQVDLNTGLSLEKWALLNHMNTPEVRQGMANFKARSKK